VSREGGCVGSRHGRHGWCDWRDAHRKDRLLHPAMDRELYNSFLDGGIRLSIWPASHSFIGAKTSDSDPGSSNMTPSIKTREQCQWDLVSLGEVMLRLDPGDRRIWTARQFDVYEGGGEYNVARGLKRCFGLNTAVVTAFADNPIGRLIEDLIFQG